MGTAIKPLSLDYHICSVQHIIATCLQHPQLQDELYCQLLRQLSGHTSSISSNTLQVCGVGGGGGGEEGRRGGGVGGKEGEEERKGGEEGRRGGGEEELEGRRERRGREKRGARGIVTFSMLI